MHTIEHKRTLIRRVRRVRGQVEALERALTDERGCGDVVQLLAATRGAIDALAAEVLCDHLAHHVAAPRVPAAARARAASELSAVIRQLVG